ncbi:hypothetical protein Bbelb_035420 [Branchiostoma belcheri]|nr:hypothetical protein Bbelb_035420 [Branchiostoma belcheri]
MGTGGGATRSYIQKGFEGKHRRPTPFLTRNDLTLWHLLKKVVDTCVEVQEEENFAQLYSRCIDDQNNDCVQLKKEIRDYLTFRDEISMHDDVIYKGQAIVIPAELREEMIQKTHVSHQGAEACIRRARETIFWPGMSAQLRERIGRCDVCKTYQPTQQREPLMPHPTPRTPWSRVSMDLMTLGNQHYLITVDNYSDYWELDELHQNTTARNVIHKCKQNFTRHGIPIESVTLKKVRGEEDLPDEPLRARFTKDVALHTLNREEIGERLQRLTGEDPETTLEMAGLPPKEQASIVRLAHFAILTANSTMDAQPVRQDQAAKDAAQAAVTLVEDAPPAPTPSDTQKKRPAAPPDNGPRPKGPRQQQPRRSHADSSSESDSDEDDLECATVRDIFGFYKADHWDERTLEESRFRQMWKKEFPKLKIPAKNRMAKCDECDTLKTLLARAQSDEDIQEGHRLSKWLLRSGPVGSAAAFKPRRKVTKYNSDGGVVHGAIVYVVKIDTKRADSARHSHDQVKLGYLMPGHTHEDVDQMFSRVSTHLLLHDAPTIPDRLQAYTTVQELTPKKYSKPTPRHPTCKHRTDSLTLGAWQQWSAENVPPHRVGRRSNPPETDPQSGKTRGEETTKRGSTVGICAGSIALSKQAGKGHPAFADKEIPGEVTIDTRVFNIAIAID